MVGPNDFVFCGRLLWYCVGLFVGTSNTNFNSRCRVAVAGVLPVLFLLCSNGFLW